MLCQLHLRHSKGCFALMGLVERRMRLSQAWQYDCKMWHVNHKVAKVLDMICHSLASHPINILLLVCAFVLV
jgi:hypothetical protein